ncbi:Uncharacterised protein [Candidatus Anstonella stagnisolia]|nr:Uncharacterised protein [Candidatus Anstonella stagnisolia]
MWVVGLDLVGIADAIRAIAVFFAVMVCAYAGLVLMTSRNPLQRAEWKEIVIGVFVGLSVIFIAPIISALLSGGNYCR